MVLAFKVISYTLPETPESQRLIETISAYWQQIGLDPKIVVMDYGSYSQTHRNTFKNAGEISFAKVGKKADMLEYANLHFMPGCMNFQF